METVAFIFVLGFAGILIAHITSSLRGNGRKVTIQVKDDDRILTSATGTSVDDALKGVFNKLYDQVQQLATPDAIQRRIDQMNTALADVRGKASDKAIVYCTEMLRSSEQKYHRLKDEELRKLEEKRRIDADLHQKHAEQKSVHKAMIAKQRRLMTDSLRYDILL